MSRRILLVALSLFAPAAGAQDAAWTGEQTVTVQMSNFKFAPSQITLKAGKPYRLHFENSSSHGHNFASPEFFAAASVRPEDQLKVSHGAVEVPGDGSVDVQVIAERAGQYRVRCTHFMHSSFGMTGAISVQ